MSTIHIILQGKGGVGKSFISWLLAQYLRKKDGANIACADTDPTNATFSSFGAFAARHIGIMTPEMNIDKSKFDDLIEMLLTHEGDSVIDNGATSFLPIMAYLREVDVIDFLQTNGKKVLIHVPLVGGQAMDETLVGLDSILKAQPASVVPWINEAFGPVMKQGRHFIGSQQYASNKDRIIGHVHLQQRSSDTFMNDIRKLTTSRLTFAEAKDAVDKAKDAKLFQTMALLRLSTVERDVNSQLQAIGL